MSRKIPLTQGKFAVVDDADYEWLNQWKWYAQKDRKNFYAARKSTTKGKRIKINMHRLILGARDGEQTDHLNGDGLNNRRKNIRLCTHAQNQWNQHHRITPAIGVIYWDKKRKKFEVRITHNGKQKYIGRYKTKSDAIAAYQKVARKRQADYLKEQRKSCPAAACIKRMKIWMKNY